MTIVTPGRKSLEETGAILVFKIDGWHLWKGKGSQT